MKKTKKNKYIPSSEYAYNVLSYKKKVKDLKNGDKIITEGSWEIAGIKNIVVSKRWFCCIPKIKIYNEDWSYYGEYDYNEMDDEVEYFVSLVNNEYYKEE